jgi:hypothetical protein
MAGKSFRECAFPQYDQNAYSTKIAGGISKGELVAALIYAFTEHDPKGSMRLSKLFWDVLDDAYKLEETFDKK